MDEGVEVVLIAVGVVVGITISTMIGAHILRAAVALYNGLAGGNNSNNLVPEPPVAKAIAITFMTNLAAFICGLLLGGMEVVERARGGGLGDNLQLVYFLVVPLVTACLLCVMLPTTFVRAIFVALCNFVMNVVIIGLGAAVGLTMLRVIGTLLHMLYG